MSTHKDLVCSKCGKLKPHTGFIYCFPCAEKVVIRIDYMLFMKSWFIEIKPLSGDNNIYEGFAQSCFPSQWEAIMILASINGTRLDYLTPKDNYLPSVISSINKGIDEVHGLIVAVKKSAGIDVWED